LANSWKKVLSPFFVIVLRTLVIRLIFLKQLSNNLLWT
jgi:hypothetical protein